MTLAMTKSSTIAPAFMVGTELSQSMLENSNLSWIHEQIKHNPCILWHQEECFELN